MRPRHAARVTRPSGRDTDGHPAETPTDKLAHKGGLHGDVTHTSPIQYRTGREGGTLVYSPRLVPVTDPGPESLGRERNKQTRTFWHRYVSVHFDTSKFDYKYVDFYGSDLL